MSKICSLCQKEFKGIGNICKDGVFCNECRDKVRLVYPDDEYDYVTSGKLSGLLKKYSAYIEAYDTVQKPENCPLCGKKMPKLIALRMLDNYICMDCAEKISKAVHLSYANLRCLPMSEIQPYLRFGFY